MRLAILVSLLLGCPRSNPTEQVPNLDPQVPVLAPTLAEAEVWGCESDEDCAVTHFRDGSCCDQLCAATSAYNKSFIERLAAQREKLCANAVCPIASCMEGNVEHTAACIEGRCTYVAKP